MGASDQSLEKLNAWLSDHNLHGQWGSELDDNGGKPRPYVWKWSEIYPGLVRAGELVPVGPNGMAEMRTVGLRNPGVKGMEKTISLGPQILMPGERTRAHRNLKNETRFVIKAPSGAVFIVDNEPFPMEVGDLIISPTWTHHDHYNGGTEPAVWLDGLDMGLVNLGTEVNDRYPAETPYQMMEKPAGYSSTTLGRLRPPWKPKAYASPPFCYRWADTYETLLGLRESEGDSFDGVHLRYAHPLTGGSTLPTFSCEVQLLRPREKTKSHRHNSTAIYYAFRGEGVTVVGEERLGWEEGDIFMVPPWQWHQHENSRQEDAILYSVTDWPAMVALGFYREESSP